MTIEEMVDRFLALYVPADAHKSAKSVLATLIELSEVRGHRKELAAVLSTLKGES